MKARVSNLCRTEAEWAKTDFVPLSGEFVIYTPDKTHEYARVKVGDGVTPLSRLAFFTESAVEAILAEYKQAAVADAGRISDYFN